MGFDAGKYLYRRQEDVNTNGGAQHGPDESDLKTEVEEEEQEEEDVEDVKEEKDDRELKPKTSEVKTEQEEEEKWYDSNTFHCQLCSLESKSLAVFGRHVEKDHAAKLSEFAASYTRTEVYYECQFCLEEVYHERSAIEEHVQTHFLTIKVNRFCCFFPSQFNASCLNRVLG